MLNLNLLLELEEYIRSRLDAPLAFMCEAPPKEAEYCIREYELDTFIEQRRKPSLREVLFRFIDDSGLHDPQVYKKAGIDRKHFSKIRSNADYRPKKQTIVALALALELDRDHADLLLSSAGYSFSDSDTHDLVFQFCLEKKIYNIHDVNQALSHLNLKPLGGLL